MPGNPRSPSALSIIDFDHLRAAHLLARIQSEPGMRADALFERSHRERLHWSTDQRPNDSPRQKIHREQGFVVRLLANDRSWQESRDSFHGSDFDAALRRVARSLSSVPLPHLELESAAWPALSGSLSRIPRRIEEAVRERRAAFPFSVELTHHRRDLLVVGPAILAEPQSENYVSFSAAIVDGTNRTVGGLFPLSSSEAGTAIGTQDRSSIGQHVASLLVERFRAREARPPHPERANVVLSPHAAAVFLHEAVAHALEADILSASGNLGDAIGLELGATSLSVLDDPNAAPVGVRRTHDDEGTPTKKRWLLREGRVGQPIADVAWSERSASVDPGCGRRASRHELAGPRSYFLDMLEGSTSNEALLSGEGLWLDQIVRGSLEPITGLVTLVAACGRRFDNGSLGERVGLTVVRGSLADLLSSVSAVGAIRAEGGAGWCAKGGQRMPVWARCPSLRLDQIQVQAP